MKETIWKRISNDVFMTRKDAEKRRNELEDYGWATEIRSIKHIKKTKPYNYGIYIFMVV